LQVQEGLTMNITVLMASGEEDTWVDAADAVDDRGSLIVLYEIPGDEVPGGMKVLEVSREFEQDPPEGTLGTPTTMTKTQTFQVAAQYAPGMWIKVEFE